MEERSKLVWEIVDRYRKNGSMLIQVLLDLQNSVGWLPEEALVEVSERLGVPLTQVYQAASFYKAFSFSPKGKHTVKVCMGTACQVRGSPRILDRIKQILKIEQGETTPDSKFSLEAVYCLGCCALGPVMVVDEEYHGHIGVSDVEKVLKSYQ